MSTLAAVKAPLYLKLARSLDEQMSRGVLRPGDRLPSVRAHLLEQAGDTGGAAAEFQAAAARTTNLRERDYLVTQAARLAAGPAGSPPPSQQG